MEDKFVLVGPRPQPAPQPVRRKWHEGRPVVSMAVLAGILLGCLLCGVFLPRDPGHMELAHADTPPGWGCWFGTDAMGRDIFTMVWYGGRVSLLIGLCSTVVSVGVAVVVGTASGLAPRWLDGLIMRLTEIFLSVPSLLLVLLIQGAIGRASVWSLSLVLGLTGWTAMARVVRTEVRQMRHSGYLIAAKCMGAGFWRVLATHLVPNFFPSILFMAVMNVRAAIAAESTLSFMGMGLPLEAVSWGSMLSLAEKEMLSGNWWGVVIPGVFLVAAMVSVTNVGNDLRRRL